VLQSKAEHLPTFCQGKSLSQSMFILEPLSFTVPLTEDPFTGSSGARVFLTIGTFTVGRPLKSGATGVDVVLYGDTSISKVRAHTIDDCTSCMDATCCAWIHPCSSDLLMIIAAINMQPPCI
jgi:hypothetical protein